MSTATLHNKDPSVQAPVEAEKKHKDDKHRNHGGWRIPKLELKVEDLSSPGSRKFFDAVKVHSLIRDAIVGVLGRLYVTPDKQPTHHKSITLCLRPMRGVAYTAINEIHFSTDYIDGIDESRIKDEILGVVRHEMVHVWQYRHGHVPSGLIEGIADWVRMKDGFVPPHWSRGGEAWDAGYQHTAYFLDWLEDTYGVGTVVWINAQLKDKKYSEDIWTELSGGKSVDELWSIYSEYYGIGNGCELKEHDGTKNVAITIKGTDPDIKAPVVEATAIPIYNAAPPPDRSTIIIDQETDTTGVESIGDTHETDSTYDPFPFRGEAALAEIFTKRLKDLRFDGAKDGKRFVKEFEALIIRVQPEMSEEDRRLLLTTSFVGEVVNSWYEETDLDDDLPYHTLIELFQQRFKGNSMRKMEIINRDAKLS